MRGALERLLRPVAEVRRDEAASALLMTLLIFLLLAAYYLMKTVREVLAKFHMVKNDSAALLDLDRELGGRGPDKGQPAA